MGIALALIVTWVALRVAVDLWVSTTLGLSSFGLAWPFLAPALLGGAGLGACLLAWRLAPGRGARAVTLAVAALLASVAAPPREPGAVALTLLLAWAMGGGLAWRLPEPRGRRLGGALALAIGTAAIAWPGDAVPTALRTNRLGLVAGPAGQTTVEDYPAQDPGTGYPRCEMVYNSWGYREREPDDASWGARPRRVLVIGDSYVWGAGIPDATGTLSDRLRAALEARAPGRFGVTSAAFPGLGYVGYAAALSRLAEPLRPTDVVVSSLGYPDLDPLDPQVLADAFAGQGWARGLLVETGALQRVHGLSAARRGQDLPRAARLRAARSLADMVEAARGVGARVLVIDHNGTMPYLAQEMPELASPLAALVCLRPPRAWDFPEGENELWYWRENHPRARLNERLAGLAADALLVSAAGAPCDRHQPDAPEAAP